MAIDREVRVYKEKINLTLMNLIPKFLTPNQLTTIGFLGGILCAIACSQSYYKLALFLWSFNRFIDGIDGSYARYVKKVTEFGGFLDIVFDFIIYCLIPIGISYDKNNEQIHIACQYMLATFCCNAVCQFFLSAILESKNNGAQKQGEMTTVTFPPALIEGTETVIVYFLFIIFHEYVLYIFITFSLGVTCNVIQRLKNAYEILDKPQNQNQKTK